MTTTFANRELTVERSPIRFTGAGLWRGVRATLPISLGSVISGLIFGVLARGAGLSMAEVALMSAAVFSGSAQFLALGLWATPLPIAGILVATLIVGLRHLLLGAALHPTLARLSRLRAYGSLFFLNDGTWALTMRQLGTGDRDAAFLLGSGLTMAVAWFVGCVAGRAGGNWIVDPSRWGFDFAFTTLFIALLVGCWRGRGDLLPWAAAAAVAIAAHRWLPGQWYIVLGALAGSAIGVLRDER